MELDFENLPALLQGRLGFALGEFPNREKFSLVQIGGAISHFANEKLLERVSELDFILLDAEAAYLSELSFVLEQLASKLRPQGLIVVFDRLGESSPRLWHRILSSGEVEFLSQTSLMGGTLCLFQYVRPRAVPPAPAPLRYRLADRCSRWLRFPWVKRAVKAILQPFSNPVFGEST